jgi:hypothetical protein
LVYTDPFGQDSVTNSGATYVVAIGTKQVCAPGACWTKAVDGTCRGVQDGQTGGGDLSDVDDVVVCCGDACSWFSVPSHWFSDAECAAYCDGNAPGLWCDGDGDIPSSGSFLRCEWDEGGQKKACPGGYK